MEVKKNLKCETVGVADFEDAREESRFKEYE